MPSSGPRAEISSPGIHNPLARLPPARPPAESLRIQHAEQLAYDLDENGKSYSTGEGELDVGVPTSEDGAGTAVQWRAVLEDSRLIDVFATVDIPRPGARSANILTAPAPSSPRPGRGSGISEAESDGHVEGLVRDLDAKDDIEDHEDFASKPYLGNAISGSFEDLDLDMRHGGPTVPAIMEAMALSHGRKRDPLNQVLDFIGGADANEVAEWITQAEPDNAVASLCEEVERRYGESKEWEDELDVPSDQEVPARAPHSAAPTTTMHSRDNISSIPSLGLKASLHRDIGLSAVGGPVAKSVSAPPGGAAGHFLEDNSVHAVPESRDAVASNEDEEWKTRQRINGVIGRMVRYLAGDSPEEDILRLRCSRYGRIVVTAVREGGPASRAGVVAGDELVSIDGWKGFRKCAPHVIHSCLKAPLTLIFVGFVGRLQAEVRVKPLPQPRLGMPRGVRLVGESAPASSSVQLCDAVVFQQDPESIFILTKEPLREDQEPQREGTGQVASGTHGVPHPTAMYELAQEDAKTLVQKAFGSIATL